MLMLSIPFESRIKKNPLLFGALLDFFFVVVNFNSLQGLLIGMNLYELVSIFITFHIFLLFHCYSFKRNSKRKNRRKIFIFVFYCFAFSHLCILNKSENATPELDAMYIQTDASQ